MGVIVRFKKWRKYNKETTANRIKAESYYNKAFIELQKQDNQYFIICNVYNLLNNYTIITTTEMEAKRIYNNVMIDLAKIIDMSLCCFNDEIQQETLLIDCIEFQNKWRINTN